MSVDSSALFRARESALQPMPARAPLTSTESPSAEQAGLLAGQLKDHLYLLPHGCIYTSPWLSSAKPTSRSSACILLTAQRKPFEFTIGRHSFAHTALAVRPFQERGLRAENRQLVSILVHPTHPEYRRFRAITNPGYQPLDRDAFNGAEELLLAAYRGELGIQGAQELLETVINITVRYLPRVRGRELRHEQLLHMLQQNQNFQLNELAEAVGVSCARMPHVFARVVGLPWRSFQLWQKVRAVGIELGSRRSLTEIAITAGFSDSAHLSNTWHHAYGAAPSKFFNNEYVQVHYGLGPEIVLKQSAPQATSCQCVCPRCGTEINH